MRATEEGRAATATRSLVGAVERQADEQPHAIAVQSGARALTYAQLDEHANRLAHRLRAHGAGRDEVVGVMAERGLELVVAIVGTLKAGAAYTPLDPESPRMRLRRQLDAVRACAVVTPAALAGRLAGAPQELLALDPELVVLGDEDATRLVETPAPEDLCAVLFTSGSTGIPKGVALEHRNLLNLIEREPDLLPRAGEGALHLAAPQFDMAAYEILGSLASGARLVCHAPGRPDPRAVCRTIADRDVTWAANATGIFHQLVEHGPEGLARLRMLLVGGEALLPRYARRFRAACPRTRLVNIYGPAETTSFCTAHEVGAEADGDAAIPIGRSVAGALFRVLGEDGAPVAPGERGELHVAGPGIARGYLHQPQLTAERFSQIPGNGDRWYRTGDVVTWRPDGVLEIHGRRDDQVKLRGYRVEPGEIEAQLVRHPGVGRAVVVTGETAGRRRLAAFVVPSDPACDAGALRAFLDERLPAYMVPASFTLLDRLPHTPNGKVDRRALAAREAPRSQADAAAATPLAREIAAVFAEVLELPAVDPAEDFLALGGESLLAVQLLGRLRLQLGVELPISAIFAARTPAALAERVVAGAGGPLLPALCPRTPDADPVPASAGQAKALMVSELAEESLPYQSQSAHRILGPLDVPALERALTALVARHEILRTTFPREDGRWLQRVHEPWSVRLVVEDLRGAADREAALELQLAAVAQLRLDPAQLPLVRWSLARLADDEHALIAVEHHVVHDGVSTAVLLREMAELYRAEVEGRTPALSPPSVQYRDFVAWQRQLVSSEQGRRTLAHWRSRLADPPPAPQLPFDRSRPARQTYRGESLRCTLGPELTERVRAAARARGVTPFAAMLAAYVALLARYGAGEELIVGSGLANRRTLASEELIGMVVNTVALRLRVDAETTLDELLQRVQREVQEAQAHQDVPFEQVVEHVAPVRARNAAPLYQTLFSFHDAAVRTIDLGDATLVPRDALPNGSAKADLNVVVVHRRGAAPAERAAGDYARVAEDGLTVVWEYNTDLFARETAEQMLERYRTLLERFAAADGEQRVASLPLDDGAALDALHAGAGRVAPYEREATVAELFSARAAETPHAVAVVAERETLTYGALERRANRLAHRLRARGVAGGGRVGVCLERSIDLVVAFLAVAKAGAAYVPLDPNDPPERLRALTEALDLRLVLTCSRHRHQLPEASLRLLCLDEDGDLAREPDTPPPSGAGPLDPLYVMFTSGSTGTPKGVAVPHRAVVRLVRGTDYVRFGPQETLLAFAAPAFDASTFELWGALLNGGRVVLAPPGALTTGELGDLVARERVTTLWLTAGLFHRVVDDRPELLGSLRQLLAGGDVLSPDHVRRALRALPEGAVLVNGYGPTEGTTFTCTHRMAPGDAIDGAVPIGRPIPNTRVYVLDADREPVPDGLPGELWIGGDGVALGYVNDAALTAERFRPDPFSAGEDARMYRSGDRVRRRPDGTLAFLGRVDRQLKVRGFRVEPGEIEETLRRHPRVADAAVVAFERGTDRALAAHVVPRSGAVPTPAELRAHAARSLPGPAVPVAWSVVERLPLTTNGKLDTSALAPPVAGTRSADEVERVAPRSDLERRLAAIWERTLDAGAVGLDDDFFELGGHSLLAVELFDAIESSLGRRLPLATIFAAPTVRQLAADLEVEDRAARRGSLVTLTPAGPGTARPPIFCASAGDGNAVGFGALARALGEEQPFHALQPRGLDGGAPLPASVAALARAYEREVRRIQPQGPYLLAGRCLGALAAYELARRLEARGERVALLAVLDSGGPLWSPRPLADGTPFDWVMNGAVRRAGAGERLGDHFDAAGTERLLSWLATPVVHGSDGMPVNRYLHEAYRQLPNVRDAYPDLAGTDAADFVGWAWVQGRAEHGLTARLLPPAPDRDWEAPLPRQARGAWLAARRERLAWRLGEAADLLTLERRPDAPARRRERMREASHRAWHGYRARPYRGVVTLLRSDEFDAHTLLERWYGVDTGGVAERRVPGTHRSMLREPDVASLAACVRELIDDALRA